MKWKLIAASVFGATTVYVPASQADDAVCRLIVAAFMKQTDAPIFLQTDVRTDFAGKIDNIFAEDAVYVSLGNGWKRIAQSRADRVARVRAQQAAEPAQDCREEGAEELDGVLTSKYRYKFGKPPISLDAQLWIGKDGLPYRWKAGVVTSTMRYVGVAVPEP